VSEYPEIKDAIEFIRKHEGFTTHSDEDLQKLIAECAAMNTLEYTIDRESGLLNGICLFRVLRHMKIMYIEGIIAENKEIMHHFLAVYNKLFPGFQVFGTREGVLVDFTRKLNLLFKKINYKII
jgi:hypothetical protein